MTKRQVRREMRANEDAAIYLYRGEVYFDDGDSVQMISASILCDLSREGFIVASDPSNASIWQRA